MEKSLEGSTSRKASIAGAGQLQPAFFRIGLAVRDQVYTAGEL
jgi:hypothetical protein